MNRRDDQKRSPGRRNEMSVILENTSLRDDGLLSDFDI